MSDLIPPDLTASDRAALGWFVLAWLGYGQLIQHLRSPRSITARLRGIRRVWMDTMLARDNRIVDASLIGHTMHSATFFASTAVVALAALLGLLGNIGRTHAALADLDFAAKTSRALVEAKLLLLAFVLAHTFLFLKLSWSLRQLNYCIALIGAAPAKPGPRRREAVAGCLAALLSLAIGGFNAGIRGYYFALAVLAWLFGPGAFALATAGIVAMLLWRQFGSEAAEAMRLGHAVLCDDDAADSARHDAPVVRGTPVGRGA